MLRFNEIPSNYYMPAKLLSDMGMSYIELKSASGGGMSPLVRWRSPKTRKVYYRSRNMRLF